MKYIKLIIVILFFSTIQAQKSNIIVEKQLITNWSDYPIYSQLTQLVNNKPQWLDEFRYLDSIDVFNITYMSDGLRIKGYMVKPKTKGKKYPCIIYNRGGNRDFGALKVSNAAITLGQLAKEGYIVIASQYRGNGGSEGKEEFGGKDVNDILILTEALKEIGDADTERIGMYGWSRGGMMTYLALARTNKIKVAAVGGAVSDAFESIKDRPEMEKEVMSELIPNYFENKQEELTKRSAIKWANKFSKEVPILVLHGNSDWRVKPEQSLRLALEFEKYRIPYRLIMFEGSDHGITEFRAEVNEHVLNWFNKYLKNQEPLPNMEYHGK
jgi:dipeptidyl aminopeptidase/acylaminoacyl peptidase